MITDKITDSLKLLFNYYPILSKAIFIQNVLDFIQFNRTNYTLFIMKPAVA